MKTIETQRLLLRPWREEDLEDLYAYARDPQVGPSAGWKPHESREESRKILQGWIHAGEGGSLTWAIVPKETGRAAGSIALDLDGRRPDIPRCRELGYALGREQWGKGYMTEAAQAVLRHGFEELGLSFVTANHYPHNQRSRRVIEKCGFRREGVLRQAARIFDGTVLDLCCYSLTAQEFAKGKPMPQDNGALMRAMCQYEGGCVQRVNHFLKVHGFAKIIGEGEGYPPQTRQLLEAAALVHDIGIRPSLEKYGSSAGPYQEKEGPAMAKAMLEELGYPPTFVERVCFLVGHHHTYSAINGADYQALVEADFLVNIFEGGMERPAVERLEKQIFRTAVGKELLRTLYLA